MNNIFNAVATINKNQVSVAHSVRPDVGGEFLAVNVPNGWDDVKKIKAKVLSFGGKSFTWRGWNSDDNICYFFCPSSGANNIATIV